MEVLKQIPDEAMFSMSRLNPDGEPEYYAAYSDGCYYIRNTDGAYQWVGKHHSPHNKFCSDEPVVIWDKTI